MLGDDDHDDDDNLGLTIHKPIRVICVKAVF